MNKTDSEKLSELIDLQTRMNESLMLQNKALQEMIKIFHVMMEVIIDIHERLDKFN